MNKINNAGSINTTTNSPHKRIHTRRQQLITSSPRHHVNDVVHIPITIITKQLTTVTVTFIISFGY
ncbi:hypothetical protein HanRHA438_Chr16g0765321 [Helianthus annuus]|nr:hypothetical protein HanIR_Chr16g0818671 [Helianthus annuus]KAJ0836295.1 hypothetical protein HanRHA438_Chr16g0765321 [Helianthus annuus]